MIEFKKMHAKSFLFPREFWDTDSGGGTVRHVVTRRAGSCRPPCVSMSHQSVTYFLFFIHSNVSNENCRYNEMKSNMALSIGTYFTLIWKLKKIFTVVMKISRKLGCSSTKLFNQIFPLQRKKMILSSKCLYDIASAMQFGSVMFAKSLPFCGNPALAWLGWWLLISLSDCCCLLQPLHNGIGPGHKLFLHKKLLKVAIGTENFRQTRSQKVLW